MSIIQEKSEKLPPLMKYPGGKEKELKYILPRLPKQCKQYYEPFVGGGAVYFSLDSDAYYINDKSAELIDLYRMIKIQDAIFLQKLRDIDQYWLQIGQVMENHAEEWVHTYKNYKIDAVDQVGLDDIISEFMFKNAQEFGGLLNRNFNIAISNFVVEFNKSIQNKMIRMRALESKKGDLILEDIVRNIEGAFKNAFYMHFRYLYNHIKDLSINISFATAIYFFVREFCYASMFRYNKQGKFNVPYGGISYNKKSIAKKIQYFTDQTLIEQLQHTVIESMDFDDFFKIHLPQKDDFVFVDPPYDTEFSTYAKNTFEKKDQCRLADFLINHCLAKFMLIIKNTDFIKELYVEGQKTANGERLYIEKFDKKYVVSFQDRNDKDAEHLLITNYAI